MARSERRGRPEERALVAELNPAQRRAVLHGRGPLLIIAGAGTGKTKVITHRIARLIAAKAARPDEILGGIEGLRRGIPVTLLLEDFVNGACQEPLTGKFRRMPLKPALHVWTKNSRMWIQLSPQEVRQLESLLAEAHLTDTGDIVITLMGGSLSQLIIRQSSFTTIQSSPT